MDGGSCLDEKKMKRVLDDAIKTGEEFVASE
jgi:hypothetical protein